MTQSSTPGAMRRLVQRRASRAPLIGLGIAALVAVGAALIPPMTVPGSAAVSGAAVVSRACPALDAGVNVGVTSTGAGVEQSALGSDDGAAVPTGTVFQATKPVRLSAPSGVLIGGTVSSSSGPGPEQGVSLVPCLAPRSELWITGVRSNDEARAELQLINLDATAADVNVSVYGRDGVVPAVGGRGIAVEGHAVTAVPLGPLVNSPDQVSLQVTSSTGRVAAYVRERDFADVDPRGANWVPTVPAPETTVVIPAVPGGSGARRLVIGNPGDRTAQVQVQALGSEGAFTPVGFDSVDVPAGSTRAFDLAAALKGQAVALRLVSSRPVVAAVEAHTASAWAVVGAARPVGSAAGAAVTLPKGAKPVVALANPTDQAAQVQVTVTGLNGAPLSSSTVDVPANGAAKVETEATTMAVVSVTGTDSPVRAALVTTATINKVAALGSTNLEGVETSTSEAMSMTPAPLLGT